MKPVSPIAETEIAQDHARLLTLWEAAGLGIRSKGRDSLAAFTRQQQGGQQTVLGIESDEGELVGALIVTHDGRKGWLNRLAVHPDYRRRGIAKDLIAAGEAWLKAQGITIIAALIEPENEISMALFAAAGYIPYDGIHYVTKRESADS